MEPKTGNRKIEKDIKGGETPVREKLRNICFFLLTLRNGGRADSCGHGNMATAESPGLLLPKHDAPDVCASASWLCDADDGMSYGLCPCLESSGCE